MNKIDLSKYEAMDFGFSAVDDIDTPFKEPLPDQPVKVANTDDISAPIMERIDAMEEKINETTDMILEVLSRIEKSAAFNFDTDEYMSLIERGVKDKLHTVEAMVMPLLTNLLKDADTKDFIKWPNRGPTIEKFIEKLLVITRS